MSGNGENSEKTNPAVVAGDEFERWNAVKEYLATNGRELVITVLVLVVAAGAVGGYQAYAAKRAGAASDALAAAKLPADLENVAKAYNGTPSAPLAMLKLAKMQFDQGNYDAAVGVYGDFLGKHAAHELAVVAALGKLHCVEAKGDANQALDGYVAFVRNNPDSFLAPQAVLGRARCLEQLGKAEEAKAVYEDFVAANPDSGWKKMAEENLATLKRELGRGVKVQPAGVSGAAAKVAPVSANVMVPPAADKPAGVAVAAPTVAAPAAGKVAGPAPAP